ncbi:MAG TPA: MFS transporter [Polyangia bacterium]|nr:MFS transporter [Polyangia bacterium]
MPTPAVLPVPFFRVQQPGPAARPLPAGLSRTAAFYLYASIIVFFLAGSSAPTSLYGTYQARWGFSPVTVTVVFGVYALAVLVALLVFGRLSDHLGRRPVLLIATLVQAFTMLLFATAQGVDTLIAARVVQGLSTGAAAGAVGAGLLDLDRAKGAVANAVGPMLGTATGALASGLMVTYLPAPTILVYAVLGAIFVAQAIGLRAVRESTTPRPGALATLRPRFNLPAQSRAAMALAVPALVAAWSLVGFYGSLGPALVRYLLRSNSAAPGGLVLAVLAASGALAVMVSHRRSPRFMTLVGATTLMAGVAITLVAISRASATVLFIGAVVAGAGFGNTFQGAIRSVILPAPASERAGVLSVLYVVAYLAMGSPAVLAGLGVVHGGGLLPTARTYGLAVIALAAVALIGTLLRRPVESNGHRISN